MVINVLLLLLLDNIGLIPRKVSLGVLINGDLRIILMKLNGDLRKNWLYLNGDSRYNVLER